MARTIPTAEPTRLTAGDSWEWDRTVADFPASAWTLHYVLSGAHPETLTFSAGEEGDLYEIRVSAATTAAYTPGLYTLTGYVTDGTDRFQVYRGSLTVLPDPATAVPEVSHAQKMVTLLQAAMQRVADGGIVEYTLPGRGTKYLTLAEARKELTFWEEQLAKENGFTGFRRVEVTFGVV